MSGEWHALAGGWGLGAAVQYTVDHLPGSGTSEVAYDVTVPLSLLCGDVAAVLENHPDGTADPGGDDPDAAPSGDDRPDGTGDTGADGEDRRRLHELAEVTATATRHVPHGVSTVAAASASAAEAASRAEAPRLPWMAQDPAIVRHAVARFDELTPRLDAAIRAAGLEGEPADALLRAVRELRSAFAGLAEALETHGLAGAPRWKGRSARRDLADQVAALHDADRTCCRAVQDAGRALPTLDDLLSGTRWDHPVVGATGRGDLAALPTTELAWTVARRPHLLVGVTDDLDDGPHHAAAPAWLAAALDPPAVTSRPDRERHTRSRTESDTSPRAGADADTSLRADGDTSLGADADSSLRVVAAVRDVCARVGAEEVERAVVLYPRLMGSLDGVPLAARVRANRLVMRADLERMRVRDAELGDLRRRQREDDDASVVARVTGLALDSWLARDEITELVTVDVERPEALRIVHRALITLSQQLLHDVVDQGRGVWGHRQVVAFSPEGRVVELVGSLDDRTEAVAVYVGGTGTTVRQYGWPVGIARALHRADPSGVTAVLVWMGAEFPAAIGTHAPFGRFARAAAVPLRDCVEGLNVPDDVPITVVAHSYGGVVAGAAEAVGLRVDRLVHVGVPGIGPGITSVREYPDHDALGRPRRVDRYALTAPGDLIRFWRRGAEAVARLGTARLAPLRSASAWFGERTLGANPMSIPGIVDLDTGVWETDRADRRAGEILFGPRGHADGVEPGTTSFRRIVAIIQGRDPRPITPPDDVTPFHWCPGR